MKSIQLTDPVYKTIRTVALETGMQDEADFLRQLAYWVVLSKLAKYEAESRSFEAKYNCRSRNSTSVYNVKRKPRTLKLKTIISTGGMPMPSTNSGR